MGNQRGIRPAIYLIKGRSYFIKHLGNLTYTNPTGFCDHRENNTFGDSSTEHAERDESVDLPCVRCVPRLKRETPNAESANLTRAIELCTSRRYGRAMA